MALKIPKQVLIFNPRLTFFSWGLTLATFAALLGNFFVGRQYAKQVDISQYILVDMWTTGSSESNSQRLADSMRMAQQESPLCQSPDNYDFWWDSAGQWKWEGHRCMPLCQENAMRTGCLTRGELAFQAPASTFFVTHITDEFHADGSQSPDHSTLPAPGNHFVMSTESMGIGLQFSFDMDIPGWFGLSSDGEVFKGSSMGAPRTVPFNTLVLDSKGQLWKTFPASPSIDLSVPELLMLAGEEDLLGGRHDLAGENMKPGGMPGGPSSRITGFQLRMMLECFNPHQAGDKRRIPDHDVDKDSPLCVATVKKDLVGWVREKQLNRVSGGTHVRTYHGIRLVVQTAGTFEFVDFNRTYLNLVSIVVLMAFPQKIVLFVTLYLLGHMSVLYRRVLNQEFSIMQEAAGMITRLITNSASFVQLQDLEHKDPLKCGISKERMAERMGRILGMRSKQIDGDEIEALVRFCFRQVLTKEERSAIGLNKGALEELGCVRAPSKPKNPTQKFIDIDHYSAACASAEQISFDAVVDLFDTDRPMSLLERVFTPRMLRNEIRHAVETARERKKTVRIDPGLATLEDEWATPSTSRALTGQGDGSQKVDKKPSSFRHPESLEDLLHSTRCAHDAIKELQQTQEHLSDDHIALEVLQHRLEEAEGRVHELEHCVEVTNVQPKASESRTTSDNRNAKCQLSARSIDGQHSTYATTTSAPSPGECSEPLMRESSIHNEASDASAVLVATYKLDLAVGGLRLATAKLEEKQEMTAKHLVALQDSVRRLVKEMASRPAAAATGEHRVGATDRQAMD